MPSPSEQILGAASACFTAHDASGRELLLRPLGALDRLRLFKALGPALAQNTMYLGMASLAVSVVAIDAVPVPAPANEAQLEALVARLGDAGLSAIADALAGQEAAAAEGETLGN